MYVCVYSGLSIVLDHSLLSSICFMAWYLLTEDNCIPVNTIVDPPPPLPPSLPPPPVEELSDFILSTMLSVLSGLDEDDVMADLLVSVTTSSEITALTFEIVAVEDIDLELLGCSQGLVDDESWTFGCTPTGSVFGFSSPDAVQSPGEIFIGSFSLHLLVGDAVSLNTNSVCVSNLNFVGLSGPLSAAVVGMSITKALFMRWAQATKI